MTNYSLRARMMILILAPTVLIGLLLREGANKSLI